MRSPRDVSLSTLAANLHYTLQRINNPTIHGFSFTLTQKPLKNKPLQQVLIILLRHKFILLLLPKSLAATMKLPSRGRPPLPIIIAIVVCSFAFIALFYTETVTFLSPRSIFKRKYSCSRKNAARKSSKVF
jgi:hypothetical protein